MICECQIRLMFLQGDLTNSFLTLKPSKIEATNRRGAREEIDYLQNNISQFLESVEKSRAKRAESINLNSKAILTNHRKWLKLNKANRTVGRVTLWIASVEIQQIQLSLPACRYYILLCQYKNHQFKEKTLLSISREPTQYQNIG